MMLLKEIGMEYGGYVVAMRRKFHRCPEPSLEEYETCRMICEELRAMGLEPRVVHNTGVVADIGDASRSGKTVLLRADIDALRVAEETGETFSSENEGLMHACGHDAHIAMNLTAAKMLTKMKDQLNGRVRVIFEPGEEIAKGALGMIGAGVMEGVSTVYGTHVLSTIPSGIFGISGGPIMASADFFTITIKGKAAHGSEPQNSIDPIAVAAAIVNELYVVFAREYPAKELTVLSFCQIAGGSTDNAIPEKVTIGGTTRAFSPKLRNTYADTMNRVIRHMAEAFRAEAELDYRWGSAPVVNDPKSAELARRAVAANFGETCIEGVEPIMGGDDFSEYEAIAPGVYVLLGVGNEEVGAVWPQHSNHFRMDESALIKGAVSAAQYAVDYLNGG